MTTRSPWRMAAMISLGVTQPGQTATSCSTHHETTASSNPGDTIKRAPHATAAYIAPGGQPFPAPTSISGQLSATARIESCAASVRKVISITFTPPANSACAVGTALFASRSTTTGTTPHFSIISIAVNMRFPPHKAKSLSSFPSPSGPCSPSLLAWRPRNGNRAPHYPAQTNHCLPAAHGQRHLGRRHKSAFPSEPQAMPFHPPTRHGRY